MAKRILLDAGHDKDDVGSIEFDGEIEAKYTLTMVKLIREALGKYECEVYLTHEGAGAVPGNDLAAELKRRSEMANELGASLLFSLHHDAGPKAARGASLFIWTDKRDEDGGLVWLNAVGNHNAPNSYKLARVMQPIIRDALKGVGVPWRGAPEQVMCAGFGILKYALTPCMLLESHFGSNETDDSIMDNVDNQRRVAEGIATAIATALSLPVKEVRDPNAVTVLLEEIELRCNARLEGERTRVDIRPIVEGLGYVITKYDAATKTVHIRKKG